MAIALPIVQSSPDLVEQLLAEQQSLSAVEQFSSTHDSEASAAPAQARYYRSLMPASPPAPGQQYSFDVDLDQCSGCKACVVACHTMNGLDEDESWRRVGTLTIGEPETPRIQHVTTACHHCEDPGCLNGCPVKAYEKDPQTGIVRHLDDQCIGCKYCTMMCPYEVPQYSERLGIVRKCDMCHQRLSAGEAPACVQSCPNEAISIVVVNTAETEFASDDRIAAGAPVSTITKPTTNYRSEYGSATKNAAPQDIGVDHVAESHWPLAVMLVATQVSVGMIFIERLAATLAWVSGHDHSVMATRSILLAALLIGGVGLNIASLHLGQPLRAWRVFLGLKTSWLSREAVVLGKYVGLLTAATALYWLPVFSDYIPQSIQQWIPAWAASLTLVMAIVVGAAGLFSSAMIYIATRRQIWRSSRTLIRFMGTAVVAGAIGVLPLLILQGESRFISVAITMFALITLASKAAWEWSVHLNPNGRGDAYDRRSRRLVRQSLSRLARYRMLAANTSLGLLCVVAAATFVSPWTAAAFAIAAGLIAIGGEIAERLLYFMSVVYDRMPGTFR
ncbi:molybdopterin oxidoreductase, iron sulfur subunit [Rhodopirellula maiorica SM1]|uniref:Molybdopterin oxidoreductase, iron sulfur subunit n=1 Tax=Rhodopirellula maiorica SM1 TaxID=1265738 RepID=M5RA46_9BACT|nr:DmsC/YnfH family molybdoenzyme membrane anchor subunit [Rhodopirellula maiorica]EMI15926.1 molybdopterin oxidoreductase, iron sulfur subunit [Rhodopirellula maiorica SM1]